MARHVVVARDGTRVMIREPIRTDAAQLMELINSAIDEPMSGLMINKKIGLKDERKWLKNRLADIRKRSTVMLVVEVNGRIMGNCDVTRRAFKEYHRAELGIVLSKEIRGKGVGEALMKQTISLAKERMKGLEQVNLKTFAYNKRAQNLYKKMGFVKTGEVPRAIKEGRRYYGEYVMVLYL